MLHSLPYKQFTKISRLEGQRIHKYPPTHTSANPSMSPTPNRRWALKTFPSDSRQRSSHPGSVATPGGNQKEVFQPKHQLLGVAQGPTPRMHVLLLSFSSFTSQLSSSTTPKNPSKLSENFLKDQNSGEIKC